MIPPRLNVSSYPALHFSLRRQTLSRKMSSPAFTTAAALTISPPRSSADTSAFARRPTFAVVLARPSLTMIQTSRGGGGKKPKSRTTKSKITTQKLGLNLPGQQIPQGFTEFSEKLNGRVTMVSFVAALAAEVLNPAHPTIVQQVGFVFAPVNQLLQGLL